MEIFPYILLRIGGGSYENLERLNLPANKYFEVIYKKKETLKNEVSDLLFKDISKLGDHKSQNRLLNKKRDLFNERNLNNFDMSTISDLIENQTKEKISEYLECIKEYEVQNKELIDSFESNLPELRERLKFLSQDWSIQNGFVFSSQSLYKNIQEYLNHSKEYTKSVKKTEVSVIKYLTRTFAKTSPFSSFNNLGLGKVSDDTDGEFLKKKDNDNNTVLSNIRLNNSIFAYIRNCIFVLKELYEHFFIIANPTITRQENQYNYLINFNNIESFQKVGINPIVDYFLSIVNENGKIKYCDFIDRVIKDELLDAPKEDIENYIYRLIELGFFEFDIGISGLDTGWVDKFIEYMNSIPCESETKKIILFTLSDLNGMVSEFRNADITGRLELSKIAYEKFSVMKKHLDDLLKPKDEKSENEKENEDKVKEEDKKKEEKKEEKTEENNNEEKKEEEDKPKPIVKNVQYYNYDLKSENIFFEDTVLEDEFSVNRNHLNIIVNDIRNLLSYFQMFEMKKDESDIMVNYFKKNYDVNTPVKLLTFYEDYIGFKKEEKKKNEKEKKEKEEQEKKAKEEKESKGEDALVDGEKKEDVSIAKPNEVVPVIQEIKNRFELQKKWFNKFIEILSSNDESQEEIRITDEILDESIKSLDIEKKEVNNTSQGFFIQFFEEKVNGVNKISAMINASFPGYGKMTSRFLNLFPDKFTEATRIWNERYGDEYLLAENIDSGIMNFNLHPALMPYEINIPGGNFVLDMDKRIPISRLLIKYFDEENVLKLIDEKTNKIVYAFDLGFQGYGGRSELFKFLQGFSLSKLVFVYSLINKIYGKFTQVNKSYNGISEKISIHPRILFNENIVLGRKEWIIPKKLLPFKELNEKESEYYSKIKKWQIEMGLPDEVYVHIKSQSNTKEEKNKAKKNYSRDDYKPQYINFRNPFLIRLFEKCLDKITENIRISEMLPASDKMLKINGKKYVTEFVVQTYNYNK